MNNPKDNRIELYRFTAALIIMIFHAGTFNNQGHPIPLGHVYVEFFFFLTGYFTYISLKNHIEDITNFSCYSIQYTLKKFRRFMPFVLMTAVLYMIVMLLGDHFVKHLSIVETIQNFTGLPFEVLLLQITGINLTPRFDAWWYLSATLFALPIIIGLFYKKIRSGGIYAYIIYFVPFLIYGSFAQEVGGLDWRREVFGLIRSGLLRGFAGLCVGCTIFDLKEQILIYYDRKENKILYTIAEVLIYALSMIIAWEWSDIANAEFLIVLLLIAGLTITFTNISYTANLDKNIFSCLGTLSLPLYICHYSIGYLIGRYLFDLNIVIKYMVYFLLSFFFAIFMLAVNKKIFEKRCEFEFHR